MNQPNFNIWNMEDILPLIDVFRFITNQDQIKLLESRDVTKEETKKIICLDITDQLLEKKIIEQNDNPWDKLQQILFERLMIEDFNSCRLRTIELNVSQSPNLDSSSNDFNDRPNDRQILRYLFGCYYRLKQLANIKPSKYLPKAESLILDQVLLYLQEPDLFPDRDKRVKNNQNAPLLLNLISHYYSTDQESVQSFVNSISEACKSTGSAYHAIIEPTYIRLTQKFISMAIDEVSLQEWFKVTGVFLQHPELARKFLERNTLRIDNSLTYQSTLLGFMLCISPLPRTTLNETTFFKNPTRSGESEHKFTEQQLGIKMELVGKELHLLFRTLLKHSETRNLFLSWLGRCLHTFKDRKKIWSNQVLMHTTTISVNDGFLMNFFTVMLHLSEPFAGPYILDTIMNPINSGFSINKKLLKIDPRYCSLSKSTHQGSPVHFLGLSEETFLVNSNKSQHSPHTTEPPNFISECFFGTHQAFTFGFRSVYERFFKLGQNISELEHALAAASNQPTPLSGPNPRDILKERIEAALSQFFNLKAVLMVPNRIYMQLHFCVATAAYLNHLVACDSYDEAINATEFKEISLKSLKEEKLSKACLQYIPEMLLENVLDFFLFLKNFNDSALTRASDLLKPLMTTIIIFMGHSSLVQNPHLRARFAEILECLMPHQPTHHRITAFMGCVDLFENHPLIEELTTSLVNVFVSIEMTGEGVQFEQKFSYRRPMYIVLEYLWGMPHHKRRLIALAQEAEINIDSARPPLFLRFINLLINDAIFLLDEALNYMNQLREAERRRKTEEWIRLSPHQRSQAESGYMHIGRLARFHNVLSLSTIGTLAWITTEIKTIFLHPALVNRIANMLNYFLKHLVGPEKDKFNVNDKNDYEFKPREILEMICKIYINLAEPDGNERYRDFCGAISADGRSYSQNLLTRASEILFRTGLSSLGTEFEKLSQLVHNIAIKNEQDDIPTDDIPDTFLDPIMSTIMVDPVLLPSSKIIVDRSTIARHLLSDQTDPFNRSPLSMEDVIPEVDLKNQIEEFQRERRAAQKK